MCNYTLLADMAQPCAPVSWLAIFLLCLLHKTMESMLLMKANNNVLSEVDTTSIIVSSAYMDTRRKMKIQQSTDHENISIGGSDS